MDLVDGDRMGGGGVDAGAAASRQSTVECRQSLVEMNAHLALLVLSVAPSFVVSGFSRTLLAQPSLAPPALLADALKAEPGVRLLYPPTDLPDYTQFELEKLGYWPPWLAADLDRDQRPDIAAVVVKPSPSGTEFGLIAVHARAPQDIEWIVDFDTDRIHGVTKGPAADTIVPLFCVQCDSNLWFRWSGEEYEPQLYAVGEQLELGGETQADLPLYSAANLASKPVTTVPHCTTVTVRKVGGTTERRWYFVETPDGERGWSPEASNSTEGGCDAL